MKKALMNASVASMIFKFNMNNIEILESLGYKVDIACNFGKENPISQEEVEDFKSILKKKHIRYVNIPCPRSIFAFDNILKTYIQLKKIADREQYDLVHTQSPIGGVLCRIAFRKARKKGTKVIYTAHGFHFFKGAPMRSWLAFYPIEKVCSYFTDVLITINKEDYTLAQRKFHAKTVKYIPGVGVDTEKFSGCKTNKKDKRKELGVKDTDFLFLSVGELSERKNQKVVLDALGKMKADESIGNIVYLIVGKGDKQEEFEDLIKEYGIEENAKLLGFRTDIDELCEAVDCFVHPSIREGLGIAPLEAMAAGLPLISASVNGMKDYTEDGVSGCSIDPIDVNQMMVAIKKMRDDETFRVKCGDNNRKKARSFDIRNTDEIMNKIYGGGIAILNG